MHRGMLYLAVVLGSAMLAAVAVAAPLALTTASPMRGADAADLRPGVRVDPGGRTIFAMNPDGGIEAISPATGELLWSTREAARPLAVLGGQLIAQAQPASAGALDVVVLDTRDGAVRQTLSVALPEEVSPEGNKRDIWAAVDQGMSTTFEARAVVLEEEPYLLWEHTRRYARGVAPRPGEDLEQKTTGASRLDLIAGHAVAVDPSTLEQPVTLPTTVQQAAQQWLASGELGTSPAPSGEVLAATRAVGERIVLKRWSLSGEPLPDVDLFSGPYLIELRSADGRHLLIGERVAPDDRQEYGWSVFSLESGQRLGQIRNHRSHAWYAVHDATLIYVALPHGRRVGGEWVVEPLTLRAVLLDGGSVIWERPLRDTSYRGTFPP